MAMSAEAQPLERTGVCAPFGFSAGTAAADIRGDGDTARLDLAIIRSEPPAAAAGVFTRNSVKGAPVVISQLTLRRGTPIGAIVVNAGNANACTGAQGFRDALRMCSTAGDALDLDPAQLLVCSTGVIGRPMPMDRVLPGIVRAAELQDATGEGAARAIFVTTGTYTREARSFAADKALELLDGPALAGLVKSAGRAPDAQQAAAVPNQIAVVCPRCGHPMMRRIARQGPNAGQAFWGCGSRSPR